MNLYTLLTLDEDYRLQNEQFYFDSLKQIGYSIDFISRKFDHFDNDLDALDFLVEHVAEVFSLKQILNNYSYKNYIVNNKNIDSFDRENEYKKFITTLNLESIQDKKIKLILTMLQMNQIDSPDYLITYFDYYLKWINLFLERIKLGIDTNDLRRIDEKNENVVELHMDLNTDIDEINKKIKLFEERQLTNIKKEVIELIINLYDKKYKEDFPIKKNFFRIVYPQLKLSVEWKLDSFIKYAESRS
jgi:hypothetical protein